MIELEQRFFPNPSCELNNQPIDVSINDKDIRELRRGETLFRRCPAGMLIKLDHLVLDNEEVWRFKCTECSMEELR